MVINIFKIIYSVLKTYPLRDKIEWTDLKWPEENLEVFIDNKLHVDQQF